jgi:hypothetical protein
LIPIYYKNPKKVALATKSLKTFRHTANLIRERNI